MPRITIIDSYNDEKVITARLLGKGTFVTCYEVEGIVYSYVRIHNKGYDFTDMSKEAIATCADSDNPHVPSIDYLGNVKNDSESLYRMPLYYNLSKENSHAWSQAQILIKMFNKNIGMINGESAYDYNMRFIELVRGKIDSAILDGIESIVTACTNYGLDYKLEFSKRNLKVDADGNLILLDIVFNMRANQAIIQARAEAYNRRNQRNQW